MKHYETIPSTKKDVNNLILDTFSKTDLEKYSLRINNLALLSGHLILESTNPEQPLSLEFEPYFDFFKDNRTNYIDADPKDVSKYTLLTVQIRIEFIIEHMEISKFYHENLLCFEINITADIAPENIMDEIFRKIQRICRPANIKLPTIDNI